MCSVRWFQSTIPQHHANVCVGVCRYGCVWGVPGSSGQPCVHVRLLSGTIHLTALLTRNVVVTAPPRFGLHGVLADDMGLGKTIQASCIMTSALVEMVRWQPDGACTSHAAV